MIKTTLLAGCALACVALSGCASPGMAELKSGTAPTATSTIALEAQKEANRHLETCHRHYVIAWPPTGEIDCPIANAAQAITPAQIAAMIDAAITKLAAIITTPPPKP